MSDRKKNLEERLASHPELRARFEQILALVEDDDERVNTADEAEDRTIEMIEELRNVSTVLRHPQGEFKVSSLRLRRI